MGVEGRFAPTHREDLEAFGQLRSLIRDRTRSVAERYQVGAYLVGRPGTSKTYTVLETLEALDTPWIYRNSRMSPMGLWVLLAEHPEHTIVLDDISTLFKEPAALQILMAALGGQPGSPRPVTYTTKDERRTFLFTGGIIAVSNLPLRRDPLADAFASRVALLEHEPSDEMIAAFMRESALRGHEDMGSEECLEVVEFLITETRSCDYRLDIRFMVGAWQDYRLWKHGKSQSSWQILVRSGIKQIVRTDRAPRMGRADRKSSEQEIAQDLYHRFPSDKSLRDAVWRLLTDKSPDSLYRRRRELEAAGRL